MLSSLLLSVLISGGTVAPHHGDLSGIRRFEPNTGQWSRDIRVLAHTRQGFLALGAQDARLVLRRQPGAAAVVLRLSWQRAARAIETLDVLPGVSNYLTGADRRRWRTGVRGYGRVRYADVAPNVDLEFYGARNGFEYDVTVRPGGDLTQFTMRLDGASRMRVDGDGALVFDTAAGPIVQPRPVAYQEIGGARHAIDVRYELRGDRIALRPAAYDRSRVLVIDPTIDFSTFVGGSGPDEVAGVAADAAGNIYVAGTTSSSDFPRAAPLLTYGGGRDAFVIKLAPDGSTLVYATYLGGAGDDYARGVAVTTAGSAYVAGLTYSSDFPTANAAQMWNGAGDAFVARLSADGASLAFSTFLGGSGTDDAHGIAVDASGAAYVAGTTQSKNFPLQNAFRTAAGGSFVTKLTASGALAYSTYFGDSDTSSWPSIRVNLYAIAVDAAGAAYVGGGSLGANSETTPGAFRTTLGTAHCEPGFRPPLPFVPCFDGVVAKLTPSGSLAYGTYLRGDDEPPLSHDIVSGIAVDGGGNAYVIGTTRNQAFPTTPGAQRTACPFSSCTFRSAHVFVARFNAAGSALVYSATLGGSQDLDSGTGAPLPVFTSASSGGGPAPGIAIDALGQTLIAGWTKSNDLAIPNAQQARMGSAGVWRLTGSAPVATPVVGQSGVVVKTVVGAADGTLYAVAFSETSGVFTVFSSQDGSTTWTEMSAPPGGDTDLSVDPNSSTTLYTRSARSGDGGATWTMLGQSLEATPLVRPGSPNVLYGAMSFGGAGPIIKSLDGGATWNDSHNGIPSGTRGVLTMSPSNPDVMYFSGRTSDPFMYGSTDGGQTWTPRPPPANDAGGAKVNPTQPLTVYCASSLGVHKSVDGGFTWTRTLNGYIGDVVAVSSTLLFARSSSGVNPDLFVSINGGNSWATVPGIKATRLLAADPATPDSLFALNDIEPDGFVAALSPTGALVYESYLGGRNTDIPYGLAATPDGGFVVAGSTTSPDFPTMNALQPAYAGNGDAFVTKLRFPQPLLGVEAPADAATVFQPFTLRGYAVDRGSAIDAGIDAVHVWAISSTGAPTFIAAAGLTIPRPDIAAWLGAQFLTSGFAVSVSGLAPGDYTVAVFAHSRVTGAFAPPQLLHLLVREGRFIFIDTPVNGATTYPGAILGGWAIDRSAESGTGISTVHVWAFPNPGSGQAAVFAGVAAYGTSRPDVAALFGSRFANSGFELTLPLLPAGDYLFAAFAFSSVTNTFLPPASVRATIGGSRPAGALDVPANNATVAGSFTVSGWMIDTVSVSGPGVDAVHVYAFPIAGGSPVFLGAATYGVSRPDVGAIFGSRFTASGFSLNAPALPSGTYDVLAIARSTIAGSFNFWRAARIIVQ